MKYSVFEFLPESGKVAELAESTDSAWWVQFGNELLVYSANDKWDKARQQYSNLASRETGREGDVSKGRMHLVVQKGRVFQLEHPDVPVIFDKGRYLVVEIDKASARNFSKGHEHCYHIEPLRENTIVFETLPKPSSRAERDQNIALLVDSLDLSRYQASLDHLVSFPTRISHSGHYTNAASWAETQFSALGMDTTTTTVSLNPTGQSLNVIATKAGMAEQSRQRILIVAHLDSINHPGGPDAVSPGADDNASGSAGVLELAASIASKNFKHDVIFILFGGEEQGLHGSTQYVAGLSEEERTQIVAVINMDMIGSVNTPTPTVLLEGAALSQNIINTLSETANTYTDLTVQVSLNPFASDHVPFLNAGIPAVLTIEGADSANSNIHTAADTLDTIDPSFSLQILAMNLALVVSLAEIEVVSEQDCGCGNSDDPSVTGNLSDLQLLSNYYQHLFAQYSRLHNEGRLLPSDYASWKALVASHSNL